MVDHGKDHLERCKRDPAYWLEHCVQSLDALAPGEVVFVFLDNLQKYRDRAWRLNVGRAPGEVRFAPRPPEDAP